MKLKLRIIIGLMFLLTTLGAQLPQVGNVRFEQRTDGSLLVDVYYDVTTSGGLPLRISMEASGDNGESWDLPCSSLSGDVGEYITAGNNKQIVWDFLADNPDTSGNNFRVRITAECMICGQTITNNLTLTEDLMCPDSVSPYLFIGAPNITLDLGGYTILGGGMDKGNIEGIIAENTDSISIINGGIENFNNGIVLYNSDHSIFKDLTFRNLEIDDPLIFTAGIVMGSSKGVLVRDCKFEYLPVAHKNGVHLGDSEVDFINIEQLAGGTGLDFSGDKPSRGSVINSRFTDITISAILIQHCDSLLIQNNVFSGNETGIYTDPFFYGSTQGIIIEGNEIYNSYAGILFHGNLNSRVFNNVIKNNNRGIVLLPKAECVTGDPPPGIECFYSSGNLISGNKVTENYLDLFHCDSCLGNTWVNNDCETSEGSEIPECTLLTATAGAHYSSVDSAAKELASDAELIKVISSRCDSTGLSYKWIYLYESPVEEEHYEIWYKNGELIVKDSVTVPLELGDEFKPFEASWIDSDSAMVLANDQEGTEFMQTDSLLYVEMKLVNLSGWFFWEVSYWAEGSFLLLRIDAVEN